MYQTFDKTSNIIRDERRKRATRMEEKSSVVELPSKAFADDHGQRPVQTALVGRHDCTVRANCPATYACNTLQRQSNSLSTAPFLLENGRVKSE